MITLQIGIIIFLLFILLIVYQDERRKKRLTRKSTRLDRFWDGGKERRKSLRIDTAIDVAYEVVSSNIARKCSSISRNISLGGINLALDEKLLPGTALRLQLNIPARPRPVFTEGRIVWVKEISKKFTTEKEQRLFAAGIEFTRMNPGDEVALHKFINQRTKNTQRQNITMEA